MNLRAARRKFLVLALLLGPCAVAAAEATPVELDLVRGKPKGGVRTVKVSRGDTIALRVRSDEAATIHVHGYDIEMSVAAGAATTVAITAALVGRFPVTSHAREAHGGKKAHEAALLYIEVHPR